MPPNKDRLYIALYARAGKARMPGKEDTYHWALIMGPKKEIDIGDRCMRYHAKEIMGAQGKSEWYFEEKEIPCQPVDMLLVRLTIAKVLDKKCLADILCRVPIRQGIPGWNCVAWIKEALDALRADGKVSGTSEPEWQRVRDRVMEYVQQKKDEHRFDGMGDFDMSKPPTYDLLEGKETIT
ncbi:hypothetical protein B0O99DRAFT_656801 [Bisporella sp. PMI_857]|nr:hypothetical protein B0O99DRAFT_656801 [Bisporella sp. PMI_857]